MTLKEKMRLEDGEIRVRRDMLILIHQVFANTVSGSTLLCAKNIRIRWVSLHKIYLIFTHTRCSHYLD